MNERSFGRGGGPSDNNDYEEVSPVGTGAGTDTPVLDENEEAMVADEVGITNSEWEMASADDQVSQLQDAGEELEEIQATLEAMDGRLDVPAFMQAHVYQQYQRVCSRLGVEAPNASIEAYGENPMANVVFRDSLESSIKEVAKNIWAAIIKAIEKMQELGQRLWNYLTDFSGKIGKRAREVAQEVTGEMAPNAKFNASAYSALCWPNGSKLVFDNQTLSKTSKWLEEVPVRIRDDIADSQKLAVSLVDVQKKVGRDGLQSNTLPLEEKLISLVGHSFLGEAIERQWGLRSNGVVDNSSVLFNSKEPVIPGGYAIYITATVKPNAVKEVDEEKLVSSIKFFEKKMVKGSEVDNKSGDGVSKKDLDSLLAAVIKTCDAVGSHRSDIQRRQQVAKQLKAGVIALQEYLLKERKKESGPRQEQWAQKAGERHAKYGSQSVGGLMRSIINSLYQRADIYSVRAMKISRAAVKLGEQFSYSEQRARTVDSTATTATPGALPA